MNDSSVSTNEPILAGVQSDVVREITLAGDVVARQRRGSKRVPTIEEKILTGFTVTYRENSPVHTRIVYCSIPDTTVAYLEVAKGSSCLLRRSAGETLRADVYDFTLDELYAILAGLRRITDKR